MSPDKDTNMSNYLAAYDVVNGATVSLTTTQGKVYRGDFTIHLANQNSRNPSEDRGILDNVVELPSGNTFPSITFPVLEIKQLDVIACGLFKKRNGPDEGPGSSPSRSSNASSVSITKLKKEKVKKGKTPAEAKDVEPIEIQLRTFVIRTALQLKVLTKLMKEVDVCGISLEGENVGRGGCVTWIIMTAGKTLIPFDIDALYEQVPDLWKTLEKYIFKNDKLIKIVHDGRAAADYLWHMHGIKFVNVFDTQIAHTMIAKEHSGRVPPLSTLSDCLELYNRRIPLEELEFLRKYESVNFSPHSPFLKKPQPPPEYLKLCAIKVKHLIPLRQNMMVKLMERYTMCVEAHLNTFKNCDDLQAYSVASKNRQGISREVLKLLESSMEQLVV